MDQRAIELFVRSFQTEPTYGAVAPGRINLIGEHTDYNDGFVMPAAIDRRISLVARPNGTGSCRLVSSETGEGEPFDLPAKWDSLPTGWFRFAASVAAAIGAKSGLDVAVSSNLPVAAGVSSSAALEVAFACLWNLVDGLGLSPLDIAQAAQRAENEGIGVQCGIMDPLASAFGQVGSAILVDTRSLVTKPVPIPGDLCLLLCDTGKSRDLAASAYNQRRAECQRACHELGLASLRDAELSDVDRLSDSVAKKRARHVVTENARVLDFASALGRCDHVAIGLLMEQSHKSLRDDYEVSCPELDAMVDACTMTAGVIGARMTGAGFGGCCVALAQRNRAAEIVRQIEHSYRTGVKEHRCQVLVTEASDGATALRLEGHLC